MSNEASGPGRDKTAPGHRPSRYKGELWEERKYSQ